MMAIFGSVFALMLVFLLIVNLYSSAAVRERLERNRADGVHRIERTDGGSGYVAISFPSLLRIVETGASVPRGSICTPDSPFVTYAQRIYEQPPAPRADGTVPIEQLVFFILDGGVPTMAEARNCMLRMWPDREILISWVIADDELLKSVSLDDIPAYIRGYADTLEPAPNP